MIRNEAEYQEASKRLAEEFDRLGEHRTRLKESGLSDVEIKRVIDPSGGPVSAAQMGYWCARMQALDEVR